jgi:hypothetical protein
VIGGPGTGVGEQSGEANGMHGQPLQRVQQCGRQVPLPGALWTAQQKPRVQRLAWQHPAEACECRHAPACVAQ